MKEKIGIWGYGEVGKAIAQFYKNPEVEDLASNHVFGELTILHVCIPYGSNFVQLVKNKMKRTKAKITFIHSSVPVGTTKKIGGDIVHSPIRGVHPHLHQGIKTFVKYVGFDDPVVGSYAAKHLRKIKLNVRAVSGTQNTEALKLWDTTQYGVMIMLNKEIKKFCDKYGLDFSIVYTDANKTYNRGYIKLGRSEVVRPFLKYMPGPIGGHCVLPNCKLLDDEIAKLILSKKY